MLSVQPCNHALWGDDEAEGGGGETFFFLSQVCHSRSFGPWLALGELQKTQSWRSAQAIVISAELGGSEVGMSLLVLWR